MLKKLMISFILITSTPYILLSYDNIYDSAVEISRYKKVSNLIDKINKLADYTKKYVINSGDLHPNTTKINTYFGITNPYIWKNGDDSGLLDVYITDNYIVIKDIFGSQPNKNIIKLFINDKKLSPLAIIDKNNIKSIKIKLDSETWNFINILKNIDNNIIVSSNEPIDTSKIWYHPNGKGGIDVYRYLGNGWILEKSLLTKDMVDTIKSKNIVSSIEELNKLPKINGSIASVVNKDNRAIEYAYDEKNDKWVKLSGSQSLLVNDVVETINPLVDRDLEKKYSDAYPGSIIKIITLLGNNIVNFTKYNDYWLAKNISMRDILNNKVIKANIYTAKNVDNLPNSNNNIPKGSVAYLVSNNIGDNFRGDDNFPELYFDGNKWIYIVPNLDTLLKMVDGKTSNSKKYYVVSQDSFFTFNNIGNKGEWVSNLKKIRATSGARLDLSYGINGWSYYSRNLCSYSELCSKDDNKEPRYTDSGIISDLYSSNSSGKLYTWIVANTSKSINGLIDNPCLSLNMDININKKYCESRPVCDNGIYDNITKKCISNVSCLKGKYIKSQKLCYIFEPLNNNINYPYIKKRYHYDFKLKIKKTKLVGYSYSKSLSKSAPPGDGFTVSFEVNYPVLVDWQAFSDDTILNVIVDNKQIAYWGGKSWEGRCSSLVKSNNGCTDQYSVDYFGGKIWVNKNFYLNVKEGGSGRTPLIGFKVFIKTNLNRGNPLKNNQATPIYETIKYCPSGYIERNDYDCYKITGYDIYTNTMCKGYIKDNKCYENPKCNQGIFDINSNKCIFNY